MVQRRLKQIVVICAAVGLMAGAASHADTPAAPTACPRDPVSVYFAAGDITASPQTQAVLGKVKEAAGECAADRFDIVAHVDAAEGDLALALALERLKSVADQLVALGLPAMQIRVATDTPDVDHRTDVGRRQLDIQFWKQGERAVREDAGADHLRVILVQRPTAI
jgi:hypothetical protein